MTGLDALSQKQLIDRQRQLTDRATDLASKMEPLFEEMKKIEIEYELIVSELNNRTNVNS
jgi:hypothetical protein